MQMQQAMQAGMAGADAMKKLSETDMSGDSALTRALQTAGASP
jgi:hypothetical protein